MSYFTREKLRSMEVELQAAEEDKLNSLLAQQLQDVTPLIEKCESFFQETVTHNRKLVNELETKLAEAENCRVKERAERKLVIAKESLRKKEEKHATDVMMLKKHKERMHEKIVCVAKDKEKYIAELKKEKAAHEEELKKLKTEMERRANLRGGIAIALVVGTFAAAVGGFFAAPVVSAAAGAAVTAVAAAGVVAAGAAGVTGLLGLLFIK